jgi:hypothetical protein
LTWGSADDWLWAHGELHACPCGRNGTAEQAQPTEVFWWLGPSNKVGDIKPPKGCLFVMEHLVMSQDKSDTCCPAVEPPGVPKIGYNTPGSGVSKWQHLTTYDISNARDKWGQR